MIQLISGVDAVRLLVALRFPAQRKEIEKGLFRGLFESEIPARIIEPIIMIIPGGDDRNLALEALEKSLAAERRIGRANHQRAGDFMRAGVVLVLLARVGIDIVALEDEELRLSAFYKRELILKQHFRTLTDCFACW